MDIYAALDRAAELSKAHEGFRSKPYLCPAGKWTIGYGSTMIEVPDGEETRWEPVTRGTSPITKEMASYYLNRHLLSLVLPVRKLCPGLDTENRFAAILDFVYNMGELRLKGSTLRQRINQQRWDLAGYEIQRWVWGKNPKTGLMVKLPGLVVRRAQEAQLLIQG